MGCSDLMPGISGGTIALILGVYKKLIQSINAISIKNFKTLTVDLFWKKKVQHLREHGDGKPPLQGDAGDGPVLRRARRQHHRRAGQVPLRVHARPPEDPGRRVSAQRPRPRHRRRRQHHLNL